MGLTLDKVVPWGRSYSEYVSMFNLTDADLGLRILGCGDGPTEFNSKLTQNGGTIVSVDPIYAFDVEQIKDRIAETYATVMSQMLKNQSDFIWETITSVKQLGHVRMSAMDVFLADFDEGKHEGRYIAGELPLLPFAKATFDIALSSHFLFLYSDHLSAEFHLQALRDMLRVAREVRVFPVLTLAGSYSPYLAQVTEVLEDNGFTVAIKRVAYEFQRGGNEMMVIKPSIIDPAL